MPGPRDVGSSARVWFAQLRRDLTDQLDRAMAAADAAEASATRAEAAVAQLMAAHDVAGGVTALPAQILPGGVQTVTVTLDHELKSVTFAVAQATSTSTASTLLGQAVVDGTIKPLGPGAVSVRVRNTGLSALAQGAISVQVLAVGPRKTT